MSKSLRWLSLIVLAGLILMAALGCKGDTPKTSLDFQVTTRSEDAVLTLFVIPRDAKGNLLDQNGTLSVKLWEKTNATPPATGDLIGQWDSLTLSTEDYQSGKGLLISLDPNDAFMGKSGQQAYIELDLTTGGKIYSTTGIVILGDLPACCGRSG